MVWQFAFINFVRTGALFKELATVANSVTT
jgi:hypothetical protein